MAIDDIEYTNNNDSTTKFAFDSLEALRKRLLDLSGRNPLLNFKHPKTSCIRIIDEAPNQIYDELLNGKKFIFIPVPEPTEKELINAGYIKIDPVTDKKTSTKYPSVEEWAKYLGLVTSFDLEPTDLDHPEAKHQDTNLQTLLYAPDLEARLRSIKGSSVSAMEESGTNILYLTLGFLEWYESKESDDSKLAPLFTLPVQIERTGIDKMLGVYRYTVQIKDDGLITNITLREKLANDFDLILPTIDDETTPEYYYQLIEETILKHKPKWKIRKQVSLTLLSFSKQAMHVDSNPKNWPKNGNIVDHPIILKFFGNDDNDSRSSGFSYENEY